MTSPLVLILVDGLRHADHPTPHSLMPELGFRDVEASLFTGTPIAIHRRLTDYVFADRSPFEPLCRAPGMTRLWNALTPRRRRLLNFLIHRGAEIMRGGQLPRASLIPPRHMRHVAPVSGGSADEPGYFGACQSLFDVLRRARRTWLYAAPPKVSPWGATDARVEAMVHGELSRLRHDFYFVKLGDLDRVSHAYGPASAQAAQCRRVTARRVNALVNAFTTMTKSVRWILFSDHGFASITRRISPPRWLASLHEAGRIHYFVDSTMIRMRILAAGDTLPEASEPGDVVPLDEETRSRFGLPWGSPQLGDRVYLAPHGSVFWPDFFCVSPPAGMHGYLPHPDCACPFEAHGFARVPPLATHADMGAWLMETVGQG